jgi:ppGpp synthetase/RelA/SpoT-type nucleotidyltranferase
MIVPKPIEQRFLEVRALVEQVGKRVQDTLSGFCKEQGFLFDWRFKSLESVAEKIESGRFPSWTDIDDLFACTIVVPSLVSESEVISFLQEKFLQIRLVRRGEAKKAPDVFRFDATRFGGQLRPPAGLDVRGATVYQISFEIQVQTLFEHAWTKATHSLVYKSTQTDWRRLRLAAQIKAAVEQLDMLLVGFAETAEVLKPSRWPAVNDKAQIATFFKEKLEEGMIPKELAPKDWTRFCDNVYRVVQAFAGDRPSGQSYGELRSIDQALSVLAAGFNQFYPDRFPRSISLFQTVIGLLSESGQFSGQRNDYYVLVTDELKMVFPGLVEGPGRQFKI